MKSLIYREFFLYRKSVFTALGVFFGLIVMGILIILSMQFGNLAKATADLTTDLGGNISTILTYMPGMILFAIPLGYFEVLDTDFSSKWMRFQYASPVNESRLVLSKLFLIGILTVCAFVGSILNALLFSLICDKPFTQTTLSLIVLIMTVFSLITITLCVLTCLFRKSTPALIIVFAAVFMTFIALSIPMLEKASDNHDIQFFDIEVMIMEKVSGIAPFLPFILAAVFVLGYLIMTALLRRREK